MSAGLYEHLITDRLGKAVAATPADLVQLGGLDPVDAHETLTRHISDLASRALRAAGGGDPTAVSRQVELANQIMAAISAVAPAAPRRTMWAPTRPTPCSRPSRPTT